jgi:hypothetical protein
MIIFIFTIGKLLVEESILLKAVKNPIDLFNEINKNHSYAINFYDYSHVIAIW